MHCVISIQHTDPSPIELCYAELESSGDLSLPSLPLPRKLYNIVIFKIKAYSRMNGTNLHSPVELQPEMHAESHLEEHPMSLL